MDKVIKDRLGYLKECWTHCGLPEPMWGGMQRYLSHGVEPGIFLTAVISNDLKESVRRADEENKRLLAAYVTFLYNYVPSIAWGSPEKYEQWVCEGGFAT